MGLDLAAVKKNLGLTDKSMGELKALFHPFYVSNLILATSFLLLKLNPPFCEHLFAPDPEMCSLTTRQREIHMFLLVVIIARSRKAASQGFLAFITKVLNITKAANVVLFFMADVKLGFVYLVLMLIQGMVLPEPIYKGPENVTYFGDRSLVEELRMDSKGVWLVAFYTSWSSSCTKFASTFAKLSAKYSLPNLKFGKLDIGRYPEQVNHFCIDPSDSRQLPTIIMFQGGKAVARIPRIIDGEIEKLIINEETVITAFNLDKLYQKCKEGEVFVPSRVMESALGEKKDQ